MSFLLQNINKILNNGTATVDRQIFRALWEKLHSICIMRTIKSGFSKLFRVKALMTG